MVVSNEEKPIRVLQIVSYMQRGGLETLLMNYYRHIDRDKVQFDFLVHRSFRSAYDDEIENMGGKIYRIPQLNPFSFKYHRALDCFFEQHREYKIVHCHLDCMSAIPLKHAMKNNVPVRIAHAHSSNQVRDYKYLLKLIYKKQIPEYANKLFACGKKAGEYMFEGQNFSILNNAIDVGKYTYNEEIRIKVRNELGFENDQFIIGHVGNFTEPKNHEFLIQVFQKIYENNHAARLLLVGDGHLVESTKELCIKNNLSNKVIFTGSRSDVFDLLQAMDIFVFPSLYEGFPVSLIEAQANGLHCFISDRIPDESILIPSSVHRISLDESASDWATKIMSSEVKRMPNSGGKITEAGYDIRKNADMLQNYYLKMHEKYL